MVSEYSIARGPHPRFTDCLCPTWAQSAHHGPLHCALAPMTADRAQRDGRWNGEINGRERRAKSMATAPDRRHGAPSDSIARTGNPLAQDWERGQGVRAEPPAG